MVLRVVFHLNIENCLHYITVLVSTDMIVVRYILRDYFNPETFYVLQIRLIF